MFNWRPELEDLDIRSISIQRKTLRFLKPIATNHGSMTQREVVLLKVVDGAGRLGCGEAAPLAGFTAESVEDVETALQGWIHEGVNPANTPSAWAAIDGALLDLAARRAESPLHELLTPGSPSRLPVTALVTGSTTHDLVQAAAQAVTAGHPGVKIKVGILQFDEDFERLSAVRAAIGEAHLRLDANGAWTVEEARMHLNRLADLQIEFVEEPVAGLEALACVRAASPVPIAVDESANSLAAIEAVLTTSAADVLILKPGALGGPGPSAEASLRAANTGIDVVITSLLDGSVGIRSAAHLASALGNTAPAPGLATASLLAVDSGPPLLPVGGHLILD